MKLAAFLICILLILPVGLNLSMDHPEEESIDTKLRSEEYYDYTIRVDGNDDLSRFPGKGTPGSPYIIEGNDIDAEGWGTAIYIGNTTKHFVIRDNTLRRASQDSSYYNWNSCLVLYNTTDGMVINNTIEGGTRGINMIGSYNISVENNLIRLTSSSAISVESSEAIDIIKNELPSNNGDGVRVGHSHDIYVEDNEIRNGRRAGLVLDATQDAMVSNNQILGNDQDGILLQESTGCTLWENRFEETGIRIIGDQPMYWDSHHIPNNNTIDHSPIFYLSDQEDGVLEGGAGQILLVNVTNFEVFDVELQQGSVGLSMAFSSKVSVGDIYISSQTQEGVFVLSSTNNVFTNITVVSSTMGIVFSDSSNNSIEDSVIMDNSNMGIESVDSLNTLVNNSNITNNGQTGIRFLRSPNSDTLNNIIEGHNRAMSLEWSDDISVLGSSIIDNNEGVFLSYSQRLVMKDNDHHGSPMRVAGNQKSHWNSHDIHNNTIDEGRLVYLADRHDEIIHQEAKQVIMANCTDVDIADRTLKYGMIIGFSSNLLVQNISIDDIREGLHIYRTQYSIFEGLNVTDNFRGIYVFSADNNSFSNIQARDNSDGLFLHSSVDNKISNSSFKNNSVGIYLSSSRSTTVDDNTFINNDDSIFLLRTTDTSIKTNEMFGGGIFIDGIEVDHWGDQDIKEDNTLDGDPIVHLVDEHDMVIPQNISQLFVVNSTHISVDDFFAEQGSVAITVAYSEKISIHNSTVSNQSRYGIYVYSSQNISVTDSHLHNNTISAIQLRYSINSQVDSNSLTDNRHGIYLWGCDHNTISSNDISEGDNGIYLRDSYDNEVRDNHIENSRNGIYLYRSHENIVSGNSAHHNDLYGIRSDLSNDNEIKDNEAYWNSQAGLFLSRADGNQIYENRLNRNDNHGIYMLSSNYNSVDDVVVSDNSYSGIYLRFSHDNEIINSRMISNRWYGVFASVSSNNVYRDNKINHNHHGLYTLSSTSNEITDNLINEEPSTNTRTILVGVKPEVMDDNELLTSLSGSVSGRITRRFEFIDVVKVTLDDGVDSTAAIQELEGNNNVRYAEPDAPVELFDLPDDPYLDELWGLNKTETLDAWSGTTGSSDAVISVLDTGIDYDHDDLIQNMWTDEDGNHGYNSIDDDLDPMDDHGHGTHVAGTIGAVGNNSVGVVGVNWDVSLMALKFISAGGTGNVSGAIACLEYVLQRKQMGDEVIATSNSWGSRSYSNALYEAIEAHRDEDILFVAASGNYGEDNDYIPVYPASYNLTNVISVAASDQNDDLASFSNHGLNTVHMAAPGVSIYSTERNDGYGYKSGTSMAAPHVSGLAALLWAGDQSLDMIGLKNSILSQVDEVSSFEGNLIKSGRMNSNSSMHADPDGFHVRPMIADGQVGTLGRSKDIFVGVTDGVDPIHVAEVVVSFDSGEEEVILMDDGRSTDQVAGDGYYSGSWTPTQSGEVTLTISVDAGEHGTYETDRTIVIRGHSGVTLSRTFNSILQNNTVSGSKDGIRLLSSHSNTLSHHNISNTIDNGLYMHDSHLNHLMNNDISENSGKGFLLRSSSDNDISSNKISYNDIAGLELSDISGWNKIQNNIFDNNEIGVQIDSGSHNNSVMDNHLSHGTRLLFVKDSYANIMSNNTLEYGGHGVYLDGSRYNIIQDNDIHDNQMFTDSTGIYLTSSHDNSIVDNGLNNNTHRGVYLRYSRSNHIYNNSIKDSQQSGVSLSSSSDNKIYNNLVQRTYRGISLLRSSDNDISNNNLVENEGNGSGYGLFLSQSSYNHISFNMAEYNDNGIGINGDNNILDSNEIYGNTKYGIYVNSRSNTVRRNNIYDNMQGIYLWAGASYNLIEDNVIYENQYGLEARFNSDYNHIDNNYFTDNDHQLFISTVSNQIIRNQISEGEVGIEIISDDNTVENNTIVQTASHAILINGGVGSRVFFNNISFNHHGVHITDWSENIHVVGNELHENEVGISVNEHSRWNILYGNDIIENMIGVSLENCGENRIHHNIFINNTQQVALTDVHDLIWSLHGEGNHWSDYEGEDITGDGIGDTKIPHPEEDLGHGYHELDDHPIVDPVDVYAVELDLYPEHDGWQFISFPITPYDTSLDAALDPLGKDLHRVFRYSEDGWLSYMKGRGDHYNTFDHVTSEDGFFLNIMDNTTLRVIGHAPIMGKTTINLRPGWNMVGHPSLLSVSAEDVLPPEITKVGVFNGSMEYNIEYLEDLSDITMRTGEGYWIYNSLSENLSYDVEW